MKIILVSDLHIHAWPEFAKPHKYATNDRLWDCVTVLDDVRKYAVEHDIKHVLVGGDVFHKPGVVHTEPFKLVAQRLDRMRRDGLTVYCVDGNHDHANRSGSIHAVQALGHAGLVKDVPVAHGFVNWWLDDDVLVQGFSYCDSRDTLRKRMDAANVGLGYRLAKARTIGLFHHGFAGAKVGSVLEYVVKEDIDPTWLNRFDVVFSGHYHTRQMIGGNKRATYIGSPMEFTRSDKDLLNDKGFLVYDAESNTWELVPLKRPLFVTIDQDMLDNGGAGEAAVGNFVDVKWEHYDGGAEALEKDCMEAGARGVKLLNVSKKRTSKAIRLDIDPTLDSKTVLQRYLKHRASEDATITPKELLPLGLDLLNKVTQ